MIVFRKFRLSAYIRRQQSDEPLVKSLRNQFGNDCVLVTGTVSAGTNKHCLAKRIAVERKDGMYGMFKPYV
ncbi:uncharacterized protein BX664DRAFT_336985 [Halteromyces radiatus]|uniref:uncharacterized protein n=1 Tax=Halteromyces radiatus TaxID=101107 RepID=UPI00221E5DC9|nr:uncharacterized protein BX664DRAFT_336985 [Halteromyces radiatus]KAI8084433.1 hypothetical protein BX664DRAFT_336985 [Halteromyces radiatus]